MQRQKPGKLEPRHFKNTLIRSRGESEAEKPALNDSAASDALYVTPKFIESATQNEANSRKEINQGTSSSVQSTSSAHKRLKLKDYIHLNSLEKRNKAKSTHTIMSEQRIKTETTIKDRNQGLQKLQVASIDLPTEARISPEENYSIMIKKEILEKINQERKRLSDLESYLDKEFACKQDKTDTFVFLFGIYNKLIDINKMNQSIGAQIVQYSKEEGQGQPLEPTNKQSFLLTPKIKKQTSYHWEESQKELDSPAKIMDNALKMTFDITKLLSITK